VLLKALRVLTVIFLDNSITLFAKQFALIRVAFRG